MSPKNFILQKVFILGHILETVKSVSIFKILSSLKNIHMEENNDCSLKADVRL